MKHLLIILVFISGMTSLALEMCASRLWGAYFGTSLLIWANLIGLISVYLTVGYFIGGCLADRYPSEQLLCALTACAAVSISILPFVSESILTWSVTGLQQVSVSIFVSSRLGTILLFAVPVTLLGLVSPFAIRFATKEIQKSGHIQWLAVRNIHLWQHLGGRFCQCSGLFLPLECVELYSSLAHCFSWHRFGVYASLEASIRPCSSCVGHRSRATRKYTLPDL